MKKTLVVLGILTLLTACQTTKLGEPKGLGATAIPLDFDIPGSQFACSRISLPLYSVEEDGAFYNDPLELEIYPSRDSSYQIRSDIPEDNYTIKSIRCYSKERYVINGAKSYIEHEVGLFLPISGNEITVPNFKVIGRQKKDRFRYGIDKSFGLKRKQMIEQIKVENDLTGWKIKDSY